MHQKKAAFLIALLVVFLSMLVAVYADSRTKKELRIADVTAFAPINPFLTNSTISANLLDLIYDSIIEYTSDGRIKAALAKEWSVSKDGSIWSFRLNRGVTFHDGAELKAKDVKATFEAVRLLKGSFYSFGFANVENIKVIADDELQIKLKRYDSFLPFFLRHVHIVPKTLVVNGVKNLPVIGSGPFKLNSFSSDQIELSANEHYFRGKPHLDTIRTSVYPSQRACLAKLIAGDADFVFVWDVADYDVFSNVKGIDVQSYLLGLSYWITMNFQNPILRNTKVRRALNYALNKERLRKRVGSYDNAHQVDTALTLFSLPYDPRKAIAILSEEGWGDTDGDSFLDKGGSRLELKLAIAENDDVSKRIARLIKGDLEGVGVHVRVETVPSFAALVKKTVERDFDMMLMPMNVRAGMPVHYLFWHSESAGNFSGYKNPDVDRLLDEIRYNPDPTKRKEAEKELAKVLKDDPPAIPLFVKRTPILVNTRFTGFSSDPFEFFRSLRSVRIKKGK